MQWGEGVLNKTPSSLTCGLFYSVSGEHKASRSAQGHGHGDITQWEAPGAHRLLNPRLKPPRSLRGVQGHGWGWWRWLKRCQQISAHHHRGLSFHPPRLTSKATVPHRSPSHGHKATWSNEIIGWSLSPSSHTPLASLSWGVSNQPGLQGWLQGPCSLNISSPKAPGSLTLGFEWASKNSRQKKYLNTKNTHYFPFFLSPKVSGKFPHFVKLLVLFWGVFVCVFH